MGAAPTLVDYNDAQVAPDYSEIFEQLTERERTLVEARLRGMTVAACAAACGITYLAAKPIFSEPHIIAALKRGREISIAATMVTREKLTNMLMEAYRAAGCAAEMVMAVKELAKLHGLNAPQQVQIDHSHRIANVKSDQLKQLSVAELERLALQQGSELIEGEFTELPRLTSGQEA